MDEHVELRCPECRAGNLAAHGSTAVRCTVCARTFPIHDGLVDLAGEQQAAPSLAQRLMQWEPLARIYESRLWRRSPAFSVLVGLSFDEEKDLLISALGLTGREKILDIACGPGLFTRAFADVLPHGDVIGLDLSLPMLCVAVRLAARRERLRFVRASALALPFADGAFDAVSCGAALHLFPDPDRAMAEMRRVLRQGGRLTVGAGRLEQPRIARALGRVTGVVPFVEDDLTRRLARAGFDDIAVVHARRAWMVISAVAC